MRLVLPLVVSVLALVALPAPAEASRYVRYGIQDDAWLASGPGRLGQRLDRLDRIGVELYRYTLRWDRIASVKPANGRDHADPAYDWGAADAIVDGLRARGIAPILTLWGTPRWANGGRGPNWAPRSKWNFASFAFAAAKRYGAKVNHWLVWNEPNKAGFFRPTTPRAYVRLLNVAHPALKAGDPNAAAVGAGVTGPRGGRGGVSPVAWIRGMDGARARLDAYAHHPYPSHPSDHPWRGGCGHCTAIEMARLERLLREVRRAFGGKRIWLTEYGYQTNPPDRFLGVSKARQARYIGSASRRAYAAPRVDMLIHFMYRDDGRAAGWQSGLVNRSGSAKPAYRAWQVPLAQVSRRGYRTVLWGQVRDRTGRQPYRLQQFRRGRWYWVGGTRRTDTRGFFRCVVRAPRGSKLRVWSTRDRVYSPVHIVR
ncbi:MAG: family 1 glycosylhydrolase [Actinomycetota bacterium]|nr:family 1 glycosylhydrolase [Actinomycetota bacterium]